MSTKNLTFQYIQFSKRVTRWGIILVSIAFVLCLAVIAFRGLQQYAISAIGSLYTAYVTIIGITIGAYQGNSSLEKWTKAKYQYSSVLHQPKDECEENIENIDSTYG